jgi:hypothetical protein
MTDPQERGRPRLGARSFVIAAGRRVMLALVALPRQVFAVWRAVSGPSAASDRSSRSADEGHRDSTLGRTIMILPIALAKNIAALVLLFSLARAAYYPFWAAGASREALDRSWGGPSPVGATLAHSLVAAVAIVTMYGVILILERLVRKRPEASSGR